MVAEISIRFLIKHSSYCQEVTLRNFCGMNLEKLVWDIGERKRIVSFLRSSSSDSKG